MPALKNILRRWRPSPVRNIVVRRRSSSGSPTRRMSNSGLAVRRRSNSGSPTRRSGPRRKLSKIMVQRIILLLIQAILLYQLLKFNRHLNNEKAAKLGLLVINGFEKVAKLFGKYDKTIVYIMSAIVKWVVYRLQKGTFKLKIRDVLEKDIWVLAGGYGSAAFGLSGIPVMKSQLKYYKASGTISGKGFIGKSKNIVSSMAGMMYGRSAAEDIRKILVHIVTYYISVLIALSSQNVIQSVISVLEHRGVINSEGGISNRMRLT